MLFWFVEKPYHSEPFTYLDAIESILIFTLSGFDVDPPNTILGWSFAIGSLLLGIFFVGAFTAEIASIFVESRMKRHSAVKNVLFRKHILVCGNLSDTEYFFEQLFHPDHGESNLCVVFLMPTPPSPLVENLLTNKKYKKRVKYIIGSPMIKQDLERANAKWARAAFIFADRFAENPDKEDAKTILRTLSIRSYNKNVVTYVQVLKAKNKGHIHSAGAHYFLCIDELSLNIIAQSCINPGLTDLIANLVNTSDEETNPSDPEWKQEYILGSGREIYRIPAGLACYGKSFAEIAASVFHQFEITLISMQKLCDNEEYTFAVNPGHEWQIDPGDYLFVIADDFDEAIKISHQEDDFVLPKHDLKEISKEKEKKESWKGKVIPQKEAILEKVPFDKHIVICGAGKYLPLLISPLRSPDLMTYKRIVILSSDPLPEEIWEKIKDFNEVYFIQGSPLDYDDLKKANIKKAAKALILNNREKIGIGDEVMIDADTVMTVMGMEVLGEDVYTIAEVIYSSNINFIQNHRIAEKNKEEKHCSVNEVVTMSRIADSIVCQSFYTENFMSIFEELFSVDTHDENEERNTCEIYQINMPDSYQNKTYGELFHFLCYTHSVIPVGLYRQTKDSDSYVFTSPPAKTKLKTDDKIYVFAADEPDI